MASAVTSSNTVSSSYAEADTSTRIPSKSLDQDDFISLLVANLSQQDPTSAAGTAEMMNQFVSLANFQAMQAVKSEVSSQNTLALYSSVSQLPGRRVEVSDGTGGTRTGSIEEAWIDAGDIRFKMSGTEYGLADVVTFLPNAASGATGAAASGSAAATAANN